MALVETMVMMAGFDLPLRAIRQQFASAINIIVQVQRMTGGARKVCSITEVTGMEGDIITMQDIFSFEQSGVGPDGNARGQFVSTGIRPSFLDRLKSLGCDLSPELFIRRVLMTDNGDG